MQTSTEISNGRARLRLQGRFELSAHRVFRSCCQTALEAGEVREIELDLADIDYFDSYGLGALLLLKESADTLHKRMIVSNCSDSIRQLMDRANLRAILDVT